LTSGPLFHVPFPRSHQFGRPSKELPTTNPSEICIDDVWESIDLIWGAQAKNPEYWSKLIVDLKKEITSIWQKA
jgi:hypothetical protein